MYKVASYPGFQGSASTELEHAHIMSEVQMYMHTYTTDAAVFIDS